MHSMTGISNDGYVLSPWPHQINVAYSGEQWMTWLYLVNAFSN